MARLTDTNRKADKKSLGRTATARTSLAIRSGITLADGFKDHVRERLGRAIDPFATRIERGTVRFEDVNGPKGGVDTLCRIKIVMSGESESVIVEQAAEDAGKAFARAVQRVARAVRRTAEKRGGRAPRATTRETAGGPKPPRRARGQRAETLIGRTAGGGKKNLKAALERPEKKRGDALVDTSAPGVSATDRRAGGAHTARRNTKKSDAGMNAALEDSLTTPSRKSTRRSGDRQKSATQLTRQAKREVSAPQQRARRAKAGS